MCTTYVIWDLSRKFTCFILAAPYDLEAMIQKSGDKVSNSHVYRRSPAFVMTGIPEKEAAIFLKSIENDFNIFFDSDAKSLLLSRIKQIKRGGLGVTVDIIFRALLTQIPETKKFYLALVRRDDREQALKVFTHKEPIIITGDIISQSMSMQR